VHECCQQQRNGEDLGSNVENIVLKLKVYNKEISNVKVGGSRPTCAQRFFRTPLENSGGTEKSAENVRTESAAPGLGSRN
jgi:hypothetical protein